MSHPEHEDTVPTRVYVKRSVRDSTYSSDGDGGHGRGHCPRLAVVPRGSDYPFGQVVPGTPVASHYRLQLRSVLCADVCQPSAKGHIGDC